MALDVARVRKDFPVLERHINGKPLVYLDSANTSQKPHAVIDAMTEFLQNGYAPINRSAYTLAAEATELFEGARSSVARFINAPHDHEIVFTRNATEAINLIAYSWGCANLNKGDVVVLTHMEHHANIVPWHMLVQERGIEIRWVPLTADGQLDLSNIDSLLTGAKLFAFTAMSNVLGTITPVAELCAKAHQHGALALVDGCQSVPHMPTDVASIGADFLAFSSHKMCGPSGIGVLWAHEKLLDAMPPFIGGGNMISDVRLDGFTCAELPYKFEAGTPPITEAIGLGAAVNYLNGMECTTCASTNGLSPKLHFTHSPSASVMTSSSTAHKMLMCEVPPSALLSATCTHTMSAKCSISTTSASAPDTIAPSRSCAS